MPPFHPNCRCTTTVYFEDDDLPSERIMRNEVGKSVKTYYMNYDEWKKKYVDNWNHEDNKLYYDILFEYKDFSPGIVEDLKEYIKIADRNS